MTPAAITVYCASSPHIEPHFRTAAERLGRALGERRLTLVYGGGRIGLMGVVARAVREAGGRVEGIITRKLLGLEQGWDQCDELVVVDTMRERKRILAERGAAFVVLPGGLGTYEEFFEILVGRQIGDHHKPIGIVNDHGYYDPLLTLIDHGVEHRFVKQAVRDLLHVAGDPARVLELVLQEAATLAAGGPGAGDAGYDPDRFLPMGRG
ncbi:MAG: TIGR00730 family Rossman fold protein [Phycisphaerales bacterium]